VRAVRAIAFALGLLATGAASSGLSQSTTPPTPPASPDTVAQGRYIAVLGDCEGCHDRPGGAPYAGGLPLNTPFGVIYSANITPDAKAGIGGWTEADFYRAMHEGQDDQHANLYPAFPYPYFTRMPRADVDALFAYLRTVPASPQAPPPNKLGFPFSIRALVTIWNWLNFKPGDFQPSPNQSAEWNRGAYLVNGPGHCGACHTPKNFLSGDEWSKPLQGGKLDNWFAPDLNGDPHGGLVSWSQADVIEFLKTGRNGRASAGASMTSVIQHSTSNMSDADLTAIATYLKSLPAPLPGPAASQVDPQVMAAGAAIYRDQCAACHRRDGTGVSHEFPPLAGDALLQASDPTTIARYILTGSPTAATAAQPTPFAMPAYAWKLSDSEIAAVATYIRNSWGNLAPPVSAHQVADLRAKVAAHPTRPPPGLD
jgi:mono/diheme cytochrome c family protein